MHLPHIPRGGRLTAFERGRCEIDVLGQSSVDELGCCRAATNRRNPLNALLKSQALEREVKVVAIQRDDSDPRPVTKGGFMPCDAFVASEQKYPQVSNVE